MLGSRRVSPEDRRARGAPLSIPLREPFVIATGRMDATRAALVTRDASRTAPGARAAASARRPRCRRSRARTSRDLLRARRARAPRGRDRVRPCLGDRHHRRPALQRPSRAPAPRCALADAGRASPGVRAARLLARARPQRRPALVDRHHPADWRSRRTWPSWPPATVRAGFHCFKVKVGRDSAPITPRCARPSRPPCPTRASASTPTPASRARDALALLDAALAAGLRARVLRAAAARATISPAWPRSRRASPVPVVADDPFAAPRDSRAPRATRAPRTA